MTEHACMRKVEGDGWVGSDKLVELKKRERERCGERAASGDGGLGRKFPFTGDAVAQTAT